MRLPRSPLLLLGAGSVVVVALVAVLAPVLAPYDPRAVVGPSFSAPSGDHLLGTTDTGQDVLSQLIWGARASAVVAVLAAGLAVGLGVVVGATAGLIGGWLDVVTMRAVDVFLAVPALPLLVLVSALAGPSTITVVLVIGLAGWPPIARVMRSRVLSLATRGYVSAARGFGGGPLYVLRRHVVPGLAPLIGASFVNWAAAAVVLQAGLAFLGLSDPTDVSWGSVLSRGLEQEGIYFTSAWTWWVLPAGLAITAFAIGLAFVGVALEPRSNPRASRV